MAEAANSFNDLLWVVFFANEEDGVADGLDFKAKCLALAAREAKNISQCTPTGDYINFSGWKAGVGL